MDSANLRQIDTIPASTPSQDLLRSILEHEKAGKPLVVTGVDGDPRWDFQHSLILGDSTLADSGAGGVSDSNPRSDDLLTFSTPPSRSSGRR
jgi:hypothetical protein